MSKDVLDVYEFVGVVLGNAGTCTAQAFAITAGQAFAIASNVTLSVYYVSTIRYKMTDQTVKKKLLPTMLGFSCLIGLPICLAPLVMGLYNPRPFEPYCYIGSYPYLCNRRSDVRDCIRGDVSARTEDTVHLIVVIGIGICFFLMLVSLILVVMSVFQTDLTTQRILKEEETLNSDQRRNNSSQMTPHYSTDLEQDNSTSLEQQGARNGSKNIDAFQETKMVLRFALMYIGAFFLTWIWTIIAIVVPVNNETIRRIFDYGKLIGPHAQGFFNALIFIYNQICFARQAKPNLSFSEALRMVIFAPSAVPEVLVSSLDVVHEDKKKMEDDLRIQELIEADFEREEQEISAISPASIPSNFLSADTPSFALSNAMSSQGVDKEWEASQKKNGDPNETRRFYTSTPKEILHWSGDTRKAAMYLDQNLTSGSAGSTSFKSGKESPFRDDNLVDNSRSSARWTPHPNSRRERPRSDRDNESGARSVFTLNSLLSGFSSALSPSSNSHISEEGEDEDVDQEGQAQNTTVAISHLDREGLGDMSKQSDCDVMSFDSCDGV